MKEIILSSIIVAVFFFGLTVLPETITGSGKMFMLFIVGVVSLIMVMLIKNFDG